MRDFVAVVIVFVLVAFALSMASSLHWYRRSHAKLRRAIADLGQSIVAEIPGRDKLRFFTEDDDAFHWDDHQILKDRVRAARVLISGAPISVCVSQRFAASQETPPVSSSSKGSKNPLARNGSIEVAPPEGIERDRWDVTIDLDEETIVVECGAIRERVSQELARRVFDAVKTDIELRNRS